MDRKLKAINSQITSMHYLEVIDWIKDKSEDFEEEITNSLNYFESDSDANDLKAKVDKRVKEIVKYNKK